MDAKLAQTDYPPMPDLDCPAWCTTDHLADWRLHVDAGRDTTPIPRADGGHLDWSDRPPLDQWCSRRYFEVTHWRSVADVQGCELARNARVRVDLASSDGEPVYVHLDAEDGAYNVAETRAIIAALQTAADQLEELART